MDIKTSELPDLVGKVLVVQVEVKDSDDEDFQEIRGKCLIANTKGLVIQTRSRSEMLALEDIIDLEVEPRVRRLTRRWIGETEPDGVRQHLLDRHGMPFDTVRLLSASDASTIHNKINHVLLGHEHGIKPHRSAGRPRYVRPVD